MKKVSVIVPFYNNKNTINRCLDSILASDYENLEIICVSDGSADGTIEEVKKYTDSRIKLILNEHGGVSKARNTGLKVATGDYIEFVDADDDINPKMISKLVKLIEDNDASMAVCNFSNPMMANYFGDRVLELKTHGDYLEFYQTTFAHQLPWDKIFKREVITCDFDETVSFCEDGLFNLYNLFNMKKIVGTSEKLYNYFVAPKTVSKKEVSTINTIAQGNEFWNTKSSFWYKRETLIEKTRVELLKHSDIIEDIDDFLYTRSFDFMFWTFAIASYNGVPLEGLKIEVNNEMREETSKKALLTREKYGLSIKNIDDNELTQLVNKYVDYLCEFETKFGNRVDDMRSFILSVMLFAKMFMEPNGKALNDHDIITHNYKILVENKTKEAIYINSLDI